MVRQWRELAVPAARGRVRKVWGRGEADRLGFKSQPGHMFHLSLSLCHHVQADYIRASQSRRGCALGRGELPRNGGL